MKEIAFLLSISSEHLPSACYVPSTVLGAEEIQTDKVGIVPDQLDLKG